MNLYCVQATIAHNTTDGEGRSVVITRQVPTFYLNADTQGITDMWHAERIAREIILPVELQYESVAINLSIEKV